MNKKNIIKLIESENREDVELGIILLKTISNPEKFLNICFERYLDDEFKDIAIVFKRKYIGIILPEYYKIHNDLFIFIGSRAIIARKSKDIAKHRKIIDL